MNALIGAFIGLFVTPTANEWLMPVWQRPDNLPRAGYQALTRASTVVA